MNKNSEDSWIRVINLSLISPSLKDNTADVDRLIRGVKQKTGVKEVSLDFPLVKRIPSLLREFDYKTSAVLYRAGLSWKLIDLLPSGGDKRLYGISVDLGTTTVVIRLLDLISGEILDEISFLNPQHDIGPDILSRIHFASENGGLEKLQALLNERIDKEITKLAEKNQIDTRSIMGMSAAGNTTMTHLFLGLNPYWICREPYIPAINSIDPVKASELGIGINPQAPVLVFPCAGSYLGGDIMAGVLASGMNNKKEVSILVDVGTNAEVVLGNKEWLIACAGAAGPALEGGVAGMGMMAGPGVIDKVVIDPLSREFDIRTIENMPPAGICGSGLIDLAAQLFLSGMIDMRGKFVTDKCGERLISIDGIKNLVIISPRNSATGKKLCLSQTDIEGLLRSKAAMYTILRTITRMMNLSMSDIGKFYIAGTFGAYIDPLSAISIGMIPDLQPSRYIPLGNTSLTGATMALLSYKAQDEIRRIRDMVTYIELNVNQDFMNSFSAAKFIPHTDRSLFPSVKEW
ncbi:ASKHA domain-containing protein [Deltaproteobacteria bacterium]|nr:ASKHA domain-containing protein [Deltaproteobacteria bacterium]